MGKLTRLVWLAAVVALVGCGDDAGGDGPGIQLMDGGTAPDGSTPPTGGDSGTTPPPVGCDYPTAGDRITLGETIPAYRWNVAFDEAGTELTFGMQEFFCNDRWADKRSLVIVISAGWCPRCPDYIQAITAARADFEAAGAQILYLVTQTRSQSELASSMYAQGHIGSGAYLGGAEESPGIRAGEGDMENAGTFVRQLNAVPSVFVIRRSDMVVTFDSRENGLYTAPGIVRAAEELIPRIPEPNCTAADEEASESVNDDPTMAPTLMNGESIMGGICEEMDLDFYRISTEGDWRVDLRFMHSVGDVDIHDVTGLENPLGTAMMGAVSETDNETYTGSGPALLRVLCYNGCTNTYTLNFTELPASDG